MNGKSCSTNLLEFMETIILNLDSGVPSDIVYLDFAKAFDKCEKGVLLHRLKECGVRGKVGCWLAAFLDPTVSRC